MTEAVKLDFAKMDGLLPAIVQDAESGQVLMVGLPQRDKLCQNIGDRLCDILEPDPAEALDEGRNQRKPAARGVGGDRLRPGYVLFRVVVEGDGLVCHQGTVSCFTQAIELPAKMEARNGR